MSLATDPGDGYTPALSDPPVIPYTIPVDTAFPQWEACSRCETNAPYLSRAYVDAGLCAACCADDLRLAKKSLTSACAFPPDDWLPALLEAASQNTAAKSV